MFLRKREGFTLISVATVFSLIAFTIAVVILADTHLFAMERRAEAAQDVVDEVVIFFRRQGRLYTTRRALYYAASSDTQRQQIKLMADNGWFTREEVERGVTFNYHQLHEKFGSSFAEVMRTLSRTTLAIENFTLSIPAQARNVTVQNVTTVDEFGRLTVINATPTTVNRMFGVSYDENEDDDVFILNCNLVINIEFQEGYRLPFMLQGRTRNVNDVIVVWGNNGVIITIPFKDLSEMPNLS